MDSRRMSERRERERAWVWVDGRYIYIDDEGNESSRQLGLVVARGTLLVLVAPVDGSEEIPNPFLQQNE